MDYPMFYFMRCVSEPDGKDSQLQAAILKFHSREKIEGWVMDPTSPLREKMDGELRIEDGKVKITLSTNQPGLEIRYFFEKSDRKRTNVVGRYEGFRTRSIHGFYNGRDRARMTLDSEV